jgi:hypothetical protein
MIKFRHHSRSGEEMERQRSRASDEEPSAQEAPGSFRQPTAAEVSALVFQKLQNVRIHAQELSNQFARLLNRGSSLE